MLVATTMPTSQADAQALRRRTARLAVYRAFLALTYLAAEAFTSRPEFTTPAAAIVLAFVAYSIVLLLYDSHALAKTFTLPILFLDLLFLISLFSGRSPRCQRLWPAHFSPSWCSKAGRCTGRGR